MDDVKRVLAWGRRKKYDGLWERTRVLHDVAPPRVHVISKPWGDVPAIKLGGGAWVKCGAPLRNKANSWCANSAGEATHHLGVGACNWHLGNTRPGNVEGLLIMAHAFAAEYETTGPQELQAELQRSAGAVRWLGKKLSEADVAEDGDRSLMPGGSLNDFLVEYNLQRAHLVRVATATINAGVTVLLQDEMSMRTQRLGTLMNDAITAMNLDQEQEDALRTELGNRLRAMADEK